MKQIVPIVVLTIISVLIVYFAGAQSKNRENILPEISELDSINDLDNNNESTRSSDIKDDVNKEATPSSKSDEATESAKKEDKVKNNIAIINTNKGVFKIELNNTLAPNYVENFIDKIGSGFYNNLTFHRVEDWVVQGGDPKGNGTGGGEIPTELSEGEFKRGVVGVARGGDIKISNDSQFFILKKDSEFLNNKYTYFGEVTEGLKVVDNIEIGDKIININIVN